MVTEPEFLDEDIEDGDDDGEDIAAAWYTHIHNYHRPIWSPFHWNMSPNQPPMPVLASRHFPPPLWPLRRRKDWEILPPPGIFPALRPYQTRFRNWPPVVSGPFGEPTLNPAFRFSHDDVQHGERDPVLRERGAQMAEEGREIRRRGRRRREEIREEPERRINDQEDWPSGGGAE